MKKTILLILIALVGFLEYSSAHPLGKTKAIDTTEIVSISNSNQVIRIKGHSLENPLLLYLNGGPGDSVLDQMDKMFSELQNEFTVILWDQRNTGKTAALNKVKEPLTQELLKKDTYQLVQYLLQKFDKKKIVLVAHSYGTTLGFDLAKNHPELLHAYVATNPLINQVESEQLTLAMLKAQAEKNKNAKSLEELAQVTIPFKTGEELYYARKWLFDLEGKSFARQKAFKTTVLSWSETWLELFNESIQENLFESTKEIHCPVFFIIGQRDYQTNSVLTEKYYNLLQAPQKEIYSIEKAGHLIPYENGREFQKVITHYLLSTIKSNTN
ncbi:alpha/beta hydrolase [Adhaeribacter arboris]|uniref:Alpha/beta hydrolase n=1 Tax=Adhaeribacter arboris TaxID=2072846 RepID=A0A2T2YBE2_9BACT|nr:alpha/beta hydrolase [Adhaeribacter arboris]PSR52827.1 alpha/beta hydrolase [Adhaeribacter arboris]